MTRCPTQRVVLIIEGVRANIDEHAESCGDRVTGVALNPVEFDELGLVEVWGLPVLAWEDVGPGHCKLLCEAFGILTPEFRTVDELLEHWRFALPRPSS